MASRDVYERAADLWRSRGVPLMPPVSPEEIGRIFESLGYPVSADVRDLYSVVGGFADFECDGLWSLWSTTRLREENAGREKILLFADYLISSHCYGFHYEDAEVSSVYITDTTERIAGSLAEFLERYISDPGSVWVWH
jgi:hypothetical protein